MTVTAISTFLASTGDVVRDLSDNADFKSFLAVALKSSGEETLHLDLSKAEFRVIDVKFGAREGLKLSDLITVWGQPMRVGALVAVYGQVDRNRLIHSLWRLTTFDEIKSWLKALRSVLRVVYDLDGQLRGNVLLAETLIPMVETVERQDYVLPNGDMASDAITRNLGIRAKVFSLDRQRRSPRSPPSNSIMDRLSRTVSKSAR